MRNRDKNKLRLALGAFFGFVLIFQYYLIRLLMVSDLSESIPFFTNDVVQQELIASELVMILPYLLIGMFSSMIMIIYKGSK